MKNIVKVLFLLLLATMFLHAAFTNTQVTAKFTYDDGTPVAATVVLYQDDSSNAVIAQQALDANGRLSINVPLDPAVAYRVQMFQGNTATSFPFMLKTLNLSPAISQAAISQISSLEIDVTIAKANNSIVGWTFVPLNTGVVPPITLKLSGCTLGGAITSLGPKIAPAGYWGWLNAGSLWSCSIQLPVAGTYTLKMTTGTINTGRSFHFEVPAGTIVGTMPIQNNGSWTPSVVESAKVTLPAGSSTLIIFADTNSENVGDSFTIQMP